jgi:hypothetical protein
MGSSIGAAIQKSGHKHNTRGADQDDSRGEDKYDNQLTVFKKQLNSRSTRKISTRKNATKGITLKPWTNRMRTLNQNPSNMKKLLILYMLPCH